MTTTRRCDRWLTALIILWAGYLAEARSDPQVALWVTNPDRSILFQHVATVSMLSQGTSSVPLIALDETKTFQTIDGFGFTLTGGSASHLARMDSPNRAALLQELFAVDSTNIGISYLRISIGASDLNAHPFSYDDLPPGAADPDLKLFSLRPDQQELIPILQQILRVNPALKILGSPWSAPTWMKTTNDFRGASLRKEYYPTYAKYFVKYIEAMKAVGIPIDAITVQNEPLHPGNNPSMYMTAQDQAEFIRSHLGPAFRTAELATKIIIYDHNCDHPDYPISILNDPEAKQFVDGAAFHLYRGKIEALSEVHNIHPDKSLYFTEQWIGGPGNLPGDLRWGVENLIIGATRHWSRTVLQWNLTSDPMYEPHTDRGGCDRCLGGVTIAGNKVTRNPGYYIIAHAAKFVRPGSVRIDSNMPAGLANVAFKTPAGKRVVIVLNSGQASRDFQIGWESKSFAFRLAGGAVVTCVWQAD